MSKLMSLVYVSSAVREMTEFELEQLLVDCRRFNQESQVTGMLLYSDGNFMQCIEGTSESIRGTFARIRQSRKHHGVIEIVEEPVAERAFPDFQMGFVHALRAQALKASTEIWERRVASHADASKDSPCIRMLETFWRQGSRFK